MIVEIKAVDELEAFKGAGCYISKAAQKQPSRSFLISSAFLGIVT
jgi:hypothetical protein